MHSGKRISRAFTSALTDLWLTALRLLKALSPLGWARNWHGALLAAGLAMTANAATALDDRNANNVLQQTIYPGRLLATSYADPARWLCHPRLVPLFNSCKNDIGAAAVEANGAAPLLPPVPWSPQTQVDCFYVYPTISTDPAANSDFLPDANEIKIIEMQFARYRSVCTAYAPTYRQRTLGMLGMTMLGGDAIPPERNAAAEELAYQDIREAFNTYLSKNFSNRGFILVGHSQGANVLARLIAEEIETQPALHKRLVAAHLLGGIIEVPVGADVGGTFAKTPACRHPQQTGCVVAYSSFRKNDPQLVSDPNYGYPKTPGMEILCTNPAALSGSAATLHPRMPFYLAPIHQLLLKPRGSGGPYADRAANLIASAETSYFTMPGQISAECVGNAGGARFLEIRIAANPADPRADDYAGEFFAGNGWGLHLLDVNLALDDLVELAQSQAAAWRWVP